MESLEVEEPSTSRQQAVESFSPAVQELVGKLPHLPAPCCDAPCCDAPCCDAPCCDALCYAMMPGSVLRCAALCSAVLRFNLQCWSLLSRAVL